MASNRRHAGQKDPDATLMLSLTAVPHPFASSTNAYTGVESELLLYVNKMKR